jgi:hypothetical protein
VSASPACQFAHLFGKVCPPENRNSAARFDQNQLCKWFGAYNFFALNMEHITMKTVASHGRLSISGLGWSCSATFVVLFVLCMLAALFVPLRLAHGWIGLWSDAPIGRARFRHDLQQHCCTPRAARDQLISQASGEHAEGRLAATSMECKADMASGSQNSC